ncbi:MAG: DNA-3-methyladenine glycosylase 2 family protein [Alphaproteobacteria bacterium]|nr:DNA-3-methyladenine glycosylase 2 family protein [Alphaproteobacteria bacterium]
MSYIPHMRTPEPFSWDRAEARAGKFNGKFLIGVLTTGIYCLPSCTARQPKSENVRILRTEDEAQALGLRACKRCRPDLFYRGEDEDISLFEGLAARVRTAPYDFPDAPALAKAAGVSLTKLGDLFRGHAHLAPAAWLRRERVRVASHRLLETSDRVLEVGYAAGFESESVFHRQFLALMRMTPGAYRAMNAASVFLLHLPAGYRAQEILAYHARDPESPTERVEGSRIFKALRTPQGPVALELSLESDGAWAKVHGIGKMTRETAALLHNSALRMLGLNNEVTAFETRMAKQQQFASLVAKRRGLRLPTTPTGFDGLCWAIIGQQVNVKFAAALRREILNLAGEKVGDMRTHPAPEKVVDLSAARLAKLRYSRAKAEYLVGAANEVAEGRLDIEKLPQGSAIAAERKLTAIRGIGKWTARYTMLRGGFADAVPCGDSALATVLQRLHKLQERPGAEHVETLMQELSPHRSLATAHLWASYRDAA